jgi:eukaryotic-like serine/threonine-protein kinase
MNTDLDLLFGVVAFQNGAVDADRLAETCNDWATEQTLPLADLLVNRGLLTAEQRTEVDKAVAHELENHGGDPHATLVATIDGRSREAIRGTTKSNQALEAKLGLPQPDQSGHVVVGQLSPGEHESRERYTLTHLHAKGGMGRVWLARDTALGRQIALKELRPDQTDNSIVFSRFLYEAKITAQLEHPGIVPVYELGEGEAPYYTMRFVKGRTLSEAIRAYHKKRTAGGADSVGMIELLTAFVGVCHAVAYAHSRGIIHRDLKGQNIVMGDFGEVMVLDWGLAKRVGPDQQPTGSENQAAAVSDLAKIIADPNQPTLGTGAAQPSQDPDCTLPDPADLRSSAAPNPPPTPSASVNGAQQSSPNGNGSAAHRSGTGTSRRPNPESGAGPDGTMQGQLLGTPAYMAPEQAQGRHDLVDQRTDVYGLGAILYEILTGRPPFIAPKTSDIIRKVCNEAPTPPRQIVAETSPGLEAVCLKALQKPAAERYTSASELAQEVQRWLADEPVRAFDEPWLTRALRWARRHKTLVTAAAALLVTATIALAISTMLVAGERNEAEAQGKQARRAVNLLTKGAEIGFDDHLDPFQQKFLAGALEYYEEFTSRVASDPAVKLEHGRAYQHMGDIERKLGKFTESEQAYQKAIQILEPLATSDRFGPDAKRSLARTLALLGDLLVRQGRDKGKAEPLYRQAVEIQEPLVSAPNPLAEDRLHLGQTLRSQGDLVRLDGKFTQAKPVYDQAIKVLDDARAVDAKHVEIRNELALATEARGSINRDLGDIKQAGQDYRRAMELLEALVTELPTVARYRESLAKACNSLGLLEENSGSLVEAERYYRRELPLVERLTQDFPDRPEHGRELARTLSNLGNVLARNRDDGAEVILRRAVEINAPLSTKHPEDLQIRFDLAKDYQCLGDLEREQGNSDAAAKSIGQSRSISEALVKAFPDRPRYSELLAMNLAGLGLVMHELGQPQAEETFQASAAIYEKLVLAHPDNVEYQIGQARCLRDQGVVVEAKGQPELAESIYRKALSRFEAQNSKAQTNEALRMQAGLLNNLAGLHRPGAEKAFRDSIAVSTRLTKQQAPANTDIHNLAIAQLNLGQLLIDEKKLPEAGPIIAQAVANFEKLVANAPKAIDFQSHSGIVLSLQGNWLDQTGKTTDGKLALESAVEHQRVAVKLSKNSPTCRELLGSHLAELADVNLKLGAYEQAGNVAIEIPKAVSSTGRADGCFTAARILARLVIRVTSDAKLTQAERSRLTHSYLGRTAVLLREAIDTEPKLAEQIKTDGDIKALEAQPEFKTIMNTLVNLKP